MTPGLSHRIFLIHPSRESLGEVTPTQTSCTIYGTFPTKNCQQHLSIKFDVPFEMGDSMIRKSSDLRQCDKSIFSKLVSWSPDITSWSIWSDKPEVLQNHYHILTLFCLQSDAQLLPGPPFDSSIQGSRKKHWMYFFLKIKTICTKKLNLFFSDLTYRFCSK